MNKSIIFYGNIYENYFDVVKGGGEKQISLIIKEKVVVILVWV